jgi:hypothetical protein
MDGNCSITHNFDNTATILSAKTGAINVSFWPIFMAEVTAGHER